MVQRLQRKGQIREFAETAADQERLFYNTIQSAAPNLGQQQLTELSEKTSSIVTSSNFRSSEDHASMTHSRPTDQSNLSKASQHSDTSSIIDSSANQAERKNKDIELTPRQITLRK